VFAQMAESVESRAHQGALVTRGAVNKLSCSQCALLMPKDLSCCSCCHFGIPATYPIFCDYTGRCQDHPAGEPIGRQKMVYDCKRASRTNWQAVQRKVACQSPQYYTLYVLFARAPAFRALLSSLLQCYMHVICRFWCPDVTAALDNTVLPTYPWISTCSCRTRLHYVLFTQLCRHVCCSKCPCTCANG